MKKTTFLLATLLLSAITGCDRLEKDMLAAPTDDQLDRYGLEDVKLGDKRADAAPKLEALLDQPWQCQSGKTGLGDKRRAYMTEECTAVVNNSKAGRLWDENLTFLKAVFVENQLCSLQLQWQTDGDYEALYDKHGNTVFSLFGQPDDKNTRQVEWQREDDQAFLRNLGNGKLALDIRNKTVMQAMHHTNP